MHQKFEKWRQAMHDLEEANRQNVAPHLRADAIRRAGETHEAVLRQMVIEIDRLRRMLSANVDRTMAVIGEGQLDTLERIDDLAGRLHQAEQTIRQINDDLAELHRAIELGGPDRE